MLQIKTKKKCERQRPSNDVGQALETFGGV